MAFAGGCGARVDAAIGIATSAVDDVAVLFSESNSRFLCEVAPDESGDFERALGAVPLARIGEVTADGRLTVVRDGKQLIDANVSDLKEAWQAPLRW
jgi:phosphoribosylformylglycinamidine synthase